MMIDSRDILKRSSKIEILLPKMIVESSIGNLESLRPSRNGQSDSAPFKPAIVRSIILLLNACCPSAVGRRIWAIGVQTIDAMFRRRSSSHIVQEIRVGTEPTLTDRDTSSAVMLPVPIVWVQAPSLNPYPNTVFRRIPFAGLSILAEGWTSGFQGTATRFHHAVAQGYTANHFFSATSTTTQIQTTCMRQWTVKNGQVSEDVPDRHWNHGTHTVSDYSIVAFSDGQFLAALAPNGIIEGTS